MFQGDFCVSMIGRAALRCKNAESRDVLKRRPRKKHKEWFARTQDIREAERNNGPHDRMMLNKCEATSSWRERRPARVQRRQTPAQRHPSTSALQRPRRVQRRRSTTRQCIIDWMTNKDRKALQIFRKYHTKSKEHSKLPDNTTRKTNNRRDRD